MMVDNTENNEFRELLADYAAPIADDGFSGHVLMQTQTPKNTALIKKIMVGSAGLLAAMVAVPQLGKLAHFLSGIKVPELSLANDTVASSLFQSASLPGLSVPSLTLFAVLALLICGLGSSYLFGGDV